jgi:hypothetical protein
MTTQTNLGGTYTFANTTKTVSRMGYRCRAGEGDALVLGEKPRRHSVADLTKTLGISRPSS